MIDGTWGIGTKTATALNPAEIKALFQLVLKRPVPAPDDLLGEKEAALTIAVGILREYEFDLASVLMLAARMWAWLEDDTDRAMVLNVVDRRYVGWNCLGKHVLVDMLTGDDVLPSMAMHRVLESTAYNPYELYARRLEMARGERSSLWEVKDAERHTAQGETPEDVGGLGEPQVVRNDTGASVPR